MAGFLAFLSANKAAIFGALFFGSEALALIPQVKSNSIFQLVFGWLKSESGN